jgi:hypothetical protein
LLVDKGGTSSPLPIAILVNTDEDLLDALGQKIAPLIPSDHEQKKGLAN